MVLGRLLYFQQEMTVWMNEDNFYLQERAMVIISRVLNFASSKVRRYVSHKVLSCHLLASKARFSAVLLSKTWVLRALDACFGSIDADGLEH